MSWQDIIKSSNLLKETVKSKGEAMSAISKELSKLRQDQANIERVIVNDYEKTKRDYQLDNILFNKD